MLRRSFLSPVGPALRRIPTQCRLAWADVLARALLTVAAHPAAANAWLMLLALPKLCLRPPPRGRNGKIIPGLQAVRRLAIDYGAHAKPTRPVEADVRPSHA